MAVVWGPIAGYYATHVPGAEFVVVPLKSEPGVRFHFAIAMGVRYGEPQWKAQIEKLIDSNQEALHKILREYGVPLVDEQGERELPRAPKLALARALVQEIAGRLPAWKAGA